MIWVILFLEWLEQFAAGRGLVHLAGEACHLAASLGMFGPCLP